MASNEESQKEKNLVDAYRKAHAIAGLTAIGATGIGLGAGKIADEAGKVEAFEASQRFDELHDCVSNLDIEGAHEALNPNNIEETAEIIKDVGHGVQEFAEQIVDVIRDFF
ncbi:hypothetical protein AFK68_19375 [Hydrocoleum sp. CS-953]|uniref:hypothetical protein n=1 Tax=Hydrocoleum sp. CS-953 TaxID=1671698 RepID=UPI000B9C02A4|nr:hypothetical protein [Hydrocoleum sp. CS-953]OZH53188.1 hypothetical protein AFK68_19375 [Hydrocoleum sp. CS-953]